MSFNIVTRLCSLVSGLHLLTQSLSASPLLRTLQWLLLTLQTLHDVGSDPSEHLLDKTFTLTHCAAVTLVSSFPWDTPNSFLAYVLLHLFWSLSEILLPWVFARLVPFYHRSISSEHPSDELWKPPHLQQFTLCCFLPSVILLPSLFFVFAQSITI